MASKTPKRKTRKQIDLEAAMSRMWLEIRQEFETTDIGIRALARKFGVKSHAMIKRRVDAENWRRDVPSMAANIATNAVLERLGCAAEQVGSQAGSQPASESASQNQKDAFETSEFSKIPGHENQVFSSAAGAPEKSGSLGGSEQTGAIRAAHRMALAQRQQLEQELDLSDRVLLFSKRVLDLLTLATSVMETSSNPEEIAQAIKTLSSIGGKQETFSGMMRAAVQGVEKGVALRRRALGMEVGGSGNGRGAAPAPATGETPESIKGLITQLSTAEILELRRTAQMLQDRARQSAQPLIEGVSEA